MEYTATEINENEGKDFREYLDAIWRHRKAGIAAFVILFSLSVIVAFTTTAIYRSSSTILIEQQEIPAELVRSTVTSFADQRIQLITQRVMTSVNLWSIVEKFELYQEELEEDPRELVLQGMRQDISSEIISAEVVDPRTGRPTQATIAFQVAYESESPALAMKVANELTSLYLNENLKDRKQHAEDTSEFLTDELNRLQKLVGNLEKDIAQFKSENSGKLPELIDLNLSILDRVERELFENDRQIQILKEREIYLTSELAQVSPASTVLTASGERVLSPYARLRVLETQLIEMQSRYSSSHPDVRRVNKEIAALKAELGAGSHTDELLAAVNQHEAELITLRQRYSETHPDVLNHEITLKKLKAQLDNASESIDEEITVEHSDNPVYLQLQTELKAMEAELAALFQRKQKLQDKFLDYEERLSQTPGVEREYRSLMRDYDNALMKYREIKAKQMEAKIALTLESERKSERFTLIEPPLVPESPIKPNRKLILVLGFIVSLGVALGLTILIDLLDDSVVGKQGVTRIVGVPPIATIPTIYTVEEVRQNKRFYIYLFIGFVALGCVGLAVFHFVFYPLDVFWFMLLRKLGI